MLNKCLQNIDNKNNIMEFSVAIISLNAQKTIKETLESVKDFKEIVVVDNGSTDQTVKIAKRYTSLIYIFKINDFKRLREFALKKITGDWVLFIDTDEIITEKNKKKLLDLWHRKRDSFDGFWIKRRNYYGKASNEYLKHGLFYPDYQLRLFKKNYRYINNPHEVPDIPIKKTFFCHEIEIFHYLDQKKLFSFFGFFYLLPFAKRHAHNLINKSFIYLIFSSIFRFIDLFFISLIRGKGIFDGYRGVMAAFNFAFHISLIYLYAVYLKIKKNH